jgi:diguanylate cyclase (GGDEF)-like protein
VDHDREAAEALCGELNQSDYEATAIDDTGEALARCREGDVDVLLLDLELTEDGGSAVRRSLMDDPQGRDVALVLAAGEQVTTPPHGREGEVLVKPYSAPRVMLHIESALRGFLPTGNIIDPATGLSNRAYFRSRLEEEVEKARRYRFPVSVVMFEINADEVVSAEEGQDPAAVDDLVPELAMVVRANSRTFDLTARYDYSQLAVLLVHTPIEHTIAYATNIIGETESVYFCVPAHPTRVKLSVGGAVSATGENLDAETMMGEAMRTLFQARLTGRLVIRDLGTKA